ncbi:MAG: M28 family peptidase [bacterium]|nr:M28 family peptidase [bacterium]
MTHQLNLRLFVALAGISLLAACTPRAEDEPAVDLMASVESATAVITAETLRGPIAVMAGDDYQGRGPGSDGDVKTQQYLAEQLREIGFQPGGADGSYEQVFDIVGVDASAPETWGFSGAGGSVDLAWWDEYIAFSGLQEPKALIEGAELVFVGYGIQAPEYDWDDIKGVDLSGKVLVFMNNDPDWDDALFEGVRRLYYGRWRYKYEQAARLGAAGAIIIHTTPSAGYPFQVVQTSWTGPQFEIPAGDEPRIQIGGWVTEEAALRIFELAGQDLAAAREAARTKEFEPVPLGVTTSLALDVELQSRQTANILGVLPGRDPELGQQYIVYSAHHDHLGVGKANDDGDDIYNGAMDNAAGVSQVLAIARALVALPERPRRSILLALVAAEEQGLLGSAYYAANPTVPPGRLAANINYDGANIWGRVRDVTYIGYGKSSLDAVVEKFAAGQGRTVKGDQFPDKGYFYRSDQFNFAKIGVPAVYFDSGTDFVDRPEGWGREQVEAWVTVHYHQPSDELVDEWSFDGMIEDARLGLETGLWLAEQDEMPTWKPGDEFEAARKEALAALGN